MAAETGTLTALAIKAAKSGKIFDGGGLAVAQAWLDARKKDWAPETYPLASLQGSSVRFRHRRLA